MLSLFEIPELLVLNRIKLLFLYIFEKITLTLCSKSIDLVQTSMKQGKLYFYLLLYYINCGILKKNNFQQNFFL